MRLPIYAALLLPIYAAALLLLPLSSLAAKPHAHTPTAKESRASIDHRLTLAQRKKLFADWMNISYRAMYDARGNEIKGDQLADKYRQQFVREHHMTLAEGNALGLEGAAKQWPAPTTKMP